MGTNAAVQWDKAAKLLHESNAQQPFSAEAEAVLVRARALIEKLGDLPTPPKAAWKKLVQQMQVPLHIGAAFTTATQHGWDSSPTMPVALVAMGELLRAADDAGILSNAGGDSSSLRSSIRQQLQQSGMLLQFGSVMAGLAAELQEQDAVVAAKGWEAEGQDLDWWVTHACTNLFTYVAGLHSMLRELWGLQDQPPPDVNDVPWLWGPDGHAVPALQLTTAALQHVSCIVQHVLPAVRERAPQQAGEMLSGLQDMAQLARCLSSSMLGPLKQHGWSNGGAMQHLLASPHLLPCAAAVLVLCFAYVSRAAAVPDSARVESSSTGRTKPGSSGSSSRRRREPGSNDGRGGGSGVAGGAPLTACQLQLLQLLGLDPELTAWPLSLGTVWVQLDQAVCACFGAVQQRASSFAAPGPLTAEQQWLKSLCLLLPTVLLPCASHQLSFGAALGLQQQQGSEVAAQQLLAFSAKAVATACSNVYRTAAAQPPAGWVEEMVTVVLQLADQLLYQQPLTPADAAAAATAPPANTPGVSSTSSGNGRWLVAAACLPLFWAILGYSHNSRAALFCEASSGSSDSYSNSSSSGVALAVSPVAARFSEFTTAAEAALRAAMAAVQSGTTKVGPLATVIRALCTDALLPRIGGTAQPVLVQHMGLCGPAALVQQQRQLYSLLSTVLKLGRQGTAGAQVCWEEQQVASSCCWAAGQAAVGLLKITAATDQQPAVDYLPSLVLFGRCCLVWAEQLAQQVPWLLWLTSPMSGDRQPLPPGQQPSTFMHEHSAALVCVPWLRAATGMRGSKLEDLAETVREWVGHLKAPAALAQLAAAGCASEQVQQQLLVLLQAENGTLQEGLTDASLAAVVRQLQATGAMLASIAVPHFCNNPACGNISGPTEVQLVSGRSCICAGCRTARYCGRGCQRAAWKQHRHVCKALAAAAADAGAQA